MNRGLKIVILTIAGVAAIAAIVYFIVLPIFSGKGNPAPAVNANLPAAGLNNSNSSARAAANNPPPPSSVSPEVDQASAARSVARTFAERLGTYTSDNGLVNFDDLKGISTAAVWKYIDGEYRKNITASMPKAGYYSVTSTAMKTNIAVVSDAEVSAAVPMQKVESGAVSKTSYTTLDLKLKKIDGDWTVSWLEWEK